MAHIVKLLCFSRDAQISKAAVCSVILSSSCMVSTFISIFILYTSDYFFLLNSIYLYLFLSFAAAPLKR